MKERKKRKRLMQAGPKESETHPADWGFTDWGVSRMKIHGSMAPKDA